MIEERIKMIEGREKNPQFSFIFAGNGPHVEIILWAPQLHCKQL